MIPPPQSTSGVSSSPNAKAIGNAVQRSPNEGQGVGSKGGAVINGVGSGAGLAGLALGVGAWNDGVDVRMGAADGSMVGAQPAAIKATPSSHASARTALGPPR